MKNILFSVIACGLIVVAGASCNSVRNVSSAVATVDFKPSCLDCDNGILLMRAWGKGNNKADAIQRACKNAIEAVIFSGITQGAGNCPRVPLLTEANARQNHVQFFNAFFNDKGSWRSFVRTDEKGGSRMASKGPAIENWEVTVSVDRQALADYLMENGFQVAL